MKLSKSSVENGIGLLETMIALTVLSISLLALVQLMATAIHQSAFSQNNTVAAGLVQEKLEELRASYVQELETGVTSDDLIAGSHTPQTVILLSPDESRMGNKIFLVSWDVAIAGKQKTITGTVAPFVENIQQSKSMEFTAVFSP